MRALSLLALFAVACQGPALLVRNNEPSPLILAPFDGVELVEGYPVTFLGTVTDTNDHPEDLLAKWVLGGEGEILCEAGPVEADGSARCEALLEEGDTRVSFVIDDPDGADGADSVQLTVRANAEPEVAIVAPDGEGPYSADSRIVLEASVSDLEEPADALALAWTDINGDTLPYDVTLDSNGTLSTTVQLAPGSHTLTLTATDAPGATGKDSVTVQVVGSGE